LGNACVELNVSAFGTIDSHRAFPVREIGFEESKHVTFYSMPHNFVEHRIRPYGIECLSGIELHMEAVLASFPLSVNMLYHGRDLIFR
jgi:hypothetical protein